MITTDGERSKKMLWFAKKQLRLIKEMEIPAKTLKLDGFTVSVNQQGEIDGGRITAPMGAAVTCTTKTGVKIAVADSWSGIFSQAQDLYHMNNEWFASEPRGVDIRVFNGDFSSEEMTNQGNTTETNTFSSDLWPVPYDILYGTANQSDYRDSLPPLAPELYSIDRVPGNVGLYPYHSGEGFWIVFTDLIVSESSAVKAVVDISRTFYASNNKTLGGRKTVSYVSGDQRYTDQDHEHLYSVQHRASGDFLITNFSDYSNIVESVGGDVFFEYGDKAISVGGGWEFSGLKLSDLIGSTSGIPNELLDFYLTYYDGSILRMGSTYSFSFGESIITLHYAFVPTEPGSGLYPTGNPESFRTYMDEHPEFRKWDTLVIFQVDGVSYVFNADDIGPVVDAMFDADIYDPISGELPDNAGRDYLIQNALVALFPYSSSGRIPYDHVMFHDHNGHVHSWTRENGTVKFSTSGLELSTIVMPTAATEEDGIRPVVSWAGAVEGVNCYSCVCEDVANNTVKAIYYGNPFTEWIEVLFPEGWNIVSVRPALVRYDKQIFFGIVKGERSQEDPTEVYKFVFCLNGKWTLLSELPFGITTFDKFSLCLFGNDPLVKSMIDIPFKEVAEPQDAVPDYSVFDYVRFI